jgi:hypothetical protein
MHVILNIFVLFIVFMLLHFVICITATCEGYEENEFYKDFQDQIFEVEEQQLLNDQGNCP